LEGFSYVLQIDMHFICTPMLTKFHSCKKWVLQDGDPYPGWHEATEELGRPSVGEG
jgi:hypothetical protein